MSGTDLALRIVFAVIAFGCLLTGILVDEDRIGCFGLIGLIFVGGACFVGALAGPDAAAHWVGVHP